MRAHRPLKFNFYHRDKNEMMPVSVLHLKSRQVTCNGSVYSFDEGEVLEFTGSKDMYYEELYENDLIEFIVVGIPKVDRIWWNGDGWQVGNFVGSPLADFICKRIGNIFQTPQFAERIINYAGNKSTHNHKR